MYGVGDADRANDAGAVADDAAAVDDVDGGAVHDVADDGIAAAVADETAHADGSPVASASRQSLPAAAVATTSAVAGGGADALTSDANAECLGVVCFAVDWAADDATMPSVLWDRRRWTSGRNDWRMMDRSYIARTFHENNICTTCCHPAVWCCI